MTTFDPGASDVLTQGLRVSPFSTAFFATSAAPIITDGLDVLVQDVMAAMATAPWSSMTRSPFSSVTGVGVETRPCAPLAADGRENTWLVAAAGSDAGKLSSPAS